MWLLILEALAALALLAFAVWWTMFSGRKRRDDDDEPPPPN
jgi:cyanate permease